MDIAACDQDAVTRHPKHDQLPKARQQTGAPRAKPVICDSCDLRPSKDRFTEFRLVGRRLSLHGHHHDPSRAIYQKDIPTPLLYRDDISGIEKK
ncbi:hypothetical protein HaLaN_14999 [Haematococcus lacustris]|uniref:Uncharacterized protein n=1 Tax=Haematococcus lacustris TaxID=44745 RepID=A0A699Z7U3_HAELA|nr:hypothetical protein HaLaN_14999 [Haematococcus lacustris]